MQSLLVLLLLVISTITFVTAQLNTPKSWQANAVLTRNGKSFSVVTSYDYDARRFSNLYSFFDGSTMRDLYYYDQKIRFQTCSDAPNSCQSNAWSLPQWVLFVSANSVGQTSVFNGILCQRFTISQGYGYSATVWFAQTPNADGFNNIVRATITKGNDTQVNFFHFLPDRQGLCF